MNFERGPPGSGAKLKRAQPRRPYCSPRLLVPPCSRSTRDSSGATNFKCSRRSGSFRLSQHQPFHPGTPHEGRSGSAAPRGFSSPLRSEQPSLSDQMNNLSLLLLVEAALCVSGYLPAADTPQPEGSLVKGEGPVWVALPGGAFGEDGLLAPPQSGDNSPHLQSKCRSSALT